MTLSRFYQDAGLLRQRQYMVDAHACQHPDATSRRGVQTTALCLMTLDLVVECGQDVALGSVMHGEMMRDHPLIFFALPPPDLTRALNHRHVGEALPTDHGRRAREWAQSV